MGCLAWDVTLPESTKRRMGAPKPKATLGYGEDERGDGFAKSLPVALCVARALIRARDGGFEPEGPGELLDEVSRLEERLSWEWLIKALNRRDLTSKEASDRLRREGFGQRSITVAVTRAQESRFIDDRRYAETFTRQRIDQGWGRRRIERSLRERGIDTDSIDGWVEAHFSSESELERASHALERKCVPLRNPYEKLVRFLVSRGFALSTARAAVSKRLDDEGDDIA